jgi:hypothetical protein
MTTAARPLGQGFGPEPFALEDRPAAPVSEAATSEDASNMEFDPSAGRFHNRENPSPSEMAEMLREVQDSLAALNERLTGLEGTQDDSSLVTRRLALNVAELGATLARRVRSLEQGDAPPPPVAPPPLPPTPVAAPFAVAPPSRPASARSRDRRRWDTLALILGAVILLGLIGIGLWVFARQHPVGGSSDRPAAAAAAPAMVNPSSPAPARAAAPAAVVPKSAPPYSARTPRHYSFYPTHHGFTHHAAPPAPPTDSPAPTGFGSFGPAATNNPPKPQI